MILLCHIFFVSKSLNLTLHNFPQTLPNIFCVCFVRVKVGFNVNCIKGVSFIGGNYLKFKKRPKGWSDVDLEFCNLRCIFVNMVQP